MASVAKSKRPRDVGQLQQGAWGSSSAQDFLEALGSVFLPATPPCQSSPCCSMPLDATSFGISAWQNPQLYFHLSTLFSFHLATLPNLITVAWLPEEEDVCRTSLHETPDAPQSACSFLVSTSLGHCQIQSKLGLSSVTSKRSKWWERFIPTQILDKRFFVLQAQSATSAVSPAQDGDSQWQNNG